MTRQEMQAKIDRKDITGVGVKVTLSNGQTRYYFYEDFDDSRGVDRTYTHPSKILCMRLYILIYCVMSQSFITQYTALLYSMKKILCFC